MAASEEIHGITPADWPDFKRLMQEFRNGKLHAKPADAPQAAPTPAAESCVAILQQSLEGAGIVTAERLQFQSDLIGYDVQLIGFWNNPDAPVRIYIDGQPSRPFRAAATADEVFDALNVLPIAQQALYAVTLGNSPQYGYYPMRWRLALYPKPPRVDDSAPEWLIQSDAFTHSISRTNYHGTGELIEVHSTLPLPDPSPLRCGAQVTCARIPNAGWGVIAAEPRKYIQGYYSAPV